MLFTSKEELSEKLVRTLSSHSQSVKNLSQQPTFKDFSLQAIYKSLRELLKENVVVKHDQIYSTNKEWLEKISELSRNTTFELHNGDSIKYRFSNFVQVDAYWRHMVKDIPQSDLAVSPYFYLPHDIWVLLPDRSTNIKIYYESFSEQQQKAFLVIGASADADKEIKQILRDDYLRVNTLAYQSFKRHEHIAIFGDYITTTKIPPKLAQKIDSIFAKEKDLASIQSKLENIFHQKTNITITLEKNKKKAALLRKKLSKDF